MCFLLLHLFVRPSLLAVLLACRGLALSWLYINPCLCLCALLFASLSSPFTETDSGIPYSLLMHEGQLFTSHPRGERRRGGGQQWGWKASWSVRWVNRQQKRKKKQDEKLVSPRFRGASSLLSFFFSSEKVQSSLTLAGRNPNSPGVLVSWDRSFRRNFRLASSTLPRNDRQNFAPFRSHLSPPFHLQFVWLAQLDMNFLILVLVWSVAEGTWTHAARSRFGRWFWQQWEFYLSLPCSDLVFTWQNLLLQN